MRKAKNVILNTVTYLAFLTLLTSVALLDSENNIPFYVAMLVSLGWLYLFAKANEKGKSHER